MNSMKSFLFFNSIIYKTSVGKFTKPCCNLGNAYQGFQTHHKLKHLPGIHHIWHSVMASPFIAILPFLPNLHATSRARQTYLGCTGCSLYFANLIFIMETAGFLSNKQVSLFLFLSLSRREEKKRNPDHLNQLQSSCQVKTYCNSSI